MKRSAALAIACLMTTEVSADEGDRWDGKTIAVQSGYGTLGTLGGGACGLVLGGAIGFFTPRKNLDPVLIAGVIGAGIGALAGTVYGVEYGGEPAGTGTTLGTTLGLTGGLVGIVGFELVVRTQGVRMHPMIRLGVYTALLVTGSILGYHASADPASQTARVPIAGLVF